MILNDFPCSDTPCASLLFGAPSWSGRDSTLSVDFCPGALAHPRATPSHLHGLSDSRQSRFFLLLQNEISDPKRPWLTPNPNPLFLILYPDPFTLGTISFES